MKNEFVCQLVDSIKAMSIQLFDIELLDALVRAEFCSGILFVADLAHHLDLGAVILDVIVKLCSRHVLELLSVADIAPELWAVELSMCLELSKSLPNDLSSADGVASMRELAEVNAVS